MVGGKPCALALVQDGPLLLTRHVVHSDGGDRDELEVLFVGRLRAATYRETYDDSGRTITVSHERLPGEMVIGPKGVTDADVAAIRSYLQDEASA
jgi:hypothetical protein